MLDFLVDAGAVLLVGALIVCFLWTLLQYPWVGAIIFITLLFLPDLQ